MKIRALHEVPQAELEDKCSYAVFDVPQVGVSNIDIPDDPTWSEWNGSSFINWIIELAQSDSEGVETRREGDASS